MNARRGFTLLEVLLAVFVLATVMGVLLSFMTQNLRALTLSQERLAAGRLAEERLRELIAEIETDLVPEPGTNDGGFDEPWEDMRWELDVEPWTVPVDLDPAAAARASTIFAAPGAPPSAPQPSVLRIVLRVFHREDDPETSSPFVYFAVEPPSSQPGPGALQPTGGSNALTLGDRRNSIRPN